MSFVGCHLDVVPANPDDWDFNPYELSINGDEVCLCVCVRAPTHIHMARVRIHVCVQVQTHKSAHERWA